MFAVIRMWYKNIAGRFFGLVTKHACDMICNASEFAVFRLYKNRTITQTQQIKMQILNQVQVNLIYNTITQTATYSYGSKCSFLQRTFTIQLPTVGRATCRIGINNAPASNGGRSLCVQISRERSYPLLVY